MRTTLARCLLLVGIVHAIITVDAGKISVRGETKTRDENGDAHQEKGEVTLKEYLDGLKEPHPPYRSQQKRDSDCAKICKMTPPANIDGQRCNSSRWIPQYVDKNGCECLEDYKCCSGACPAIELKSCWDGNQKGLKYGIEEVDSCGCHVVKCEDCDPAASRDVVCPAERPANCYTYNATAIFLNDTGCFNSTCEENTSDATDEECDGDLKNCTTATESLSHCKFPYISCEPSRHFEDCPRRYAEDNKPSGLPMNCFEPPVKVPDENGGQYFEMINNTKTCQQCMKWIYPKKDCSSQNLNARREDCHQYGEHEFDKKCWKRSIVTDECECEEAVCSFNHHLHETEAKFAEGEVCPKNHVKLEGVSICGVARDVCFPCPPLQRVIDCEFGKVIQGQDDNGCPINKCERATIANGTKTGCRSFRYNEAKNQLDCAEDVFKFHSERLSWPDAQNTCLKNGMRLAIIDTEDKYDIIRKVVKDRLHWIGGRCIEQNYYYWDKLGGRVRFDFSTFLSRWRSDELDSCDTTVDGIAVKDGQFDDRNQDDNTYPFICEESDMPEYPNNLRLIRDSKINYVGGRVEVLHDGKWGTVCDDDFGTSDAKVVCRMMGFSEGVVRPKAYFGQGSEPTWLDEVNCDGSESSLFDCRHNSWGDENCKHDEDVGVECF